MNSAARKTPSSVCAWIVGSRTDSGCLSGFVQHEQRPEEVLPRREDREHRDDAEDRLATSAARSTRTAGTGPRRRSRAASKISRGRLSKNRLHEHDVEGARAGGQPDRPVAVDERVVDQRRVHDLEVERHEQHDRRARTASPAARPVRIVPYRGRSTESAKPAGGRDDDLREPRAEREHDRVPEVVADVDVDHASRRLLQADAVREERHRVRDRVLRRRDRRLREPEERPEPDDDEQRRAGRACAVPTPQPHAARAASRRARSSARCVRGVAARSPASARRDHVGAPGAGRAQVDEREQREERREHQAERGRLP